MNTAERLNCLQTDLDKIVTRYSGEAGRHKKTALTLKITSVIFAALITVLLGNAAVIVGVILFGRIFLRICFSLDYVEYYPQLVLAIMINLLASLAGVTTQMITTLRKFRTQLVINSWYALVSLVACMIFVPQFGVTGALLALGMLSTVRCILNAVVMAFTAMEKSPSCQ